MLYYYTQLFWVFENHVISRCQGLFLPAFSLAKKSPGNEVAAYSVKLVFLHVVKGMNIKITAKFRTSRHLRFENTKRIMSHEIHPKSFGTFEKRAPDLTSCAAFGLARVINTILRRHHRKSHDTASITLITTTTIILIITILLLLIIIITLFKSQTYLAEQVLFSWRD